jgi:prolyl oligopeptidase
MKRQMSEFRWAALSIVALALLVAACGSPQGFDYPQTRKGDHVDTYFGTAVPDPFRWLEDDHAPETIEWVKAQNKVTFAYLESIPYRQRVLARLEELDTYEKYSAPFKRGDYFFFRKNDGTQNQSVLYIQKGLDAEPDVLIDPNLWSEDGTTALTAFSPSRDSRYAAYGVSHKGSDWQEYRVLELATKNLLADKLEWIKVSGIAWHGDGFYYSRYPTPSGSELSSINENHQVFFHRIGTPQSADVLVYEDPANPQRFHSLSTTQDERFAILSISERGKGLDGNAIFVRDLSKKETGFRPVIPTIGDDSFGVIDNVGGNLLVRTNRDAPNGRVVLIDPSRPGESDWKTVLAEREEPLQSVSTAGGKLFATYLVDVTTRAYVYSLTGTLENEVQLPGAGSAGGFGGQRGDTFVFYTFNSMNVPPEIYRYDIKTRESTIFRSAKVPGFDPSAYETKQVFFRSKDGTQIPMFLVHKKDLARDGNNPTLLYGYGGFNISTLPGFSALRLALLEQGFIYASANLRGGGEYGKKWHEAGTKLNKQNVFDDFIAAAEWLVQNKYTSPERLAIQGGSNGGLLVGAVMNQRPDLFRVAIPQVGVMDMLRFHKFTIGWNWIADYGSSDDPEQFKALYAYSPLHNIKAATNYPATLITTADHDDRVVPAHSFKYAATLQERARRENPSLIRIETASGHGASSVAKQRETTADVYAFILHNLGVTPQW